MIQGDEIVVLLNISLLVPSSRRFRWSSSPPMRMSWGVFKGRVLCLVLWEQSSHFEKMCALLS